MSSPTQPQTPWPTYASFDQSPIQPVSSIHHQGQGTLDGHHLLNNQVKTITKTSHQNTIILNHPNHLQNLGIHRSVKNQVVQSPIHPGQDNDTKQ